MARQEVACARTLIKFARQRTTYTSGGGSTTTWEPIKVQIGKNDDDTPIMTDCFYCEWLNAYGAAAIQQQADGVARPARVRMAFVQCVYDALIDNNVQIYLHGIADAAHTFTLASSPDNYLNANQMLEFNVKQFVKR